MDFTHFNESGRARMVDVGNKDDTERVAKASCFVEMKEETLYAIIDGKIKKGDVLSVAQVGGIMAAKRTYELVPMCHNILITGCDIDFEIDRESNRIKILSTVKTRGKTGVEMEALTAASVCALTIYDMCKAIDRGMIIGDLKLVEKDGGKSGHYIRKD